MKALQAEGDEPTRIHLTTLGNRLVGLGLFVAFGIRVLAGDIVETMFGNGYGKDSVAIMPW